LFISASTRFGFYVNITSRTAGYRPAQAERILFNAKLRQFGQWLQEQNDIKINDTGWLQDVNGTAEGIEEER
jgi:hypothetical protein